MPVLELGSSHGPFGGLFDKQSWAVHSRHVKGHDASAFVAIGIVAHHAFALWLAVGTEGKGLFFEEAIVRDLFRVCRPHQIESRVEHVYHTRILTFELE